MHLLQTKRSVEAAGRFKAADGRDGRLRANERVKPAAADGRFMMARLRAGATQLQNVSDASTVQRKSDMSMSSIKFRFRLRIKA